MSNHFDLAIVGAGILGLATAFEFLERHPNRSVVVLEKEPDVACHQSGRNSGVIHAGVYYKPGSRKAENCTAGRLLLERFCEREHIAFKRCGKLIVATSASEEGRLHVLYERAIANGVTARYVNPDEAHELEPHVQVHAAVHVAETGVVSFPVICRRLCELLWQTSADVRFSSEVLSVADNGRKLHLEGNNWTLTADRLVNCAGLYADRLARAMGLEFDLQIVPFRGEYYELRPEAASLCRTLIYPVPDPSFPFLGVHFTRGIDDVVECGPNAVLAFSREGYRFGDVRATDLFESLSFSGFQKLAARHWRMGLGEYWRSLSKTAFHRALQRLIPEVSRGDLVRGRAGIRAQALRRDGTLVDDFYFERTSRSLHVLNAPSPAATSCFSIAKYICEQLEEL